MSQHTTNTHRHRHEPHRGAGRQGVFAHGGHPRQCAQIRAFPARRVPGPVLRDAHHPQREEPDQHGCRQGREQREVPL